MSEHSDDVVTVAAGDVVTMELCKQALDEAGIHARVVGGALDSSFGTAIPQSVELWVLRADVAKAKAAVARWEQSLSDDKRAGRQFARPNDDALPKSEGGRGPHGHYQKDAGTS